MPTPSRKRKHSEVQSNENEDQETEDVQRSDDEGTIFEGIYIPAPTRKSTTRSSKTRLMITEITNNFFKSYAKNAVLGPFTKCFNAIVGPNGSGKSNVIDSMLFVFGYRASKIRSKKLSVLLHNSENYRNIQSCTVSIHFCEVVDKHGRDYEVVPGSEFVITRTASKDNSSFYQLNGEKVQFKEVAKLLRKHGVDLDHNRFLILQGEVEEIAMMKCKGANEHETGMLEYLEDIIGTNKYKKPLEQLLEMIENLSVLRVEKLNRLKLIEKELEQLKEPMTEALYFLNLENKIAVFKNFLYQKYIFELEEELKTIEEDKIQITEHQNNMKNRLKELSEEKSEKDKLLKRESAQYDKLRQKKEQLKEAFNTADSNDVQLRAEMVQTNKNRKRFEEQLAKERSILAQLEKVPEENANAIAECEAKEMELTEKKDTIEDEKAKLLSTLQEETKDLQLEKEKRESKLENLKKRVDATKSAYDLAESELKIACSSEENEKKKLVDIKQSVVNTKNTITQRSEKISQLKRKIPPTEKSINDALKDLQNITSEEGRVRDEIKRKRTHLEEIRSSMQKSKSRGRVLESLIQQKREGNCPGLFGRLGDLGAIDLKYDVAISTACGPLDHIIVDTVETAQWCIEFLKKYEIGRGSFIALSKQEHLREVANRRIQTPENVNRLFDLVQIQDERVKPAFYFALRDTLVADDLEQASRIAYGSQRYRVVTLQGELIEISGMMSGGGKTVSKGRMGQSVATDTNPREIETIESNLQKCEDRLKDLIQNRGNLENQIDTLQPELNQMTTDYGKFKQELQSLREQLPLLEQQLARQESVTKSTKTDDKQIQELTALVKQKKQEFDDAFAASEKVQVVVDKLTKEINDKTSGKMNHINKQLDETVKTIGKCKRQIITLRVAIQTAERNAIKAAREIKTLEQNIVDAENKLRQMKSERETIEEDGQKLLKCIEEITEEVRNGEEQYAALKEEVSELTKEENKLKLKKVDVDQTYKTITGKLNESKASLQQWQVKLSRLKLHEIPGNTAELTKYTHEEIQLRKAEEIELELKSAQSNIKSCKPNLNVIQEYQKGENVYKQRAQELESVTEKRSQIRNLFEQVKNQRKEEFMVGYNIIRFKLKEMYQMITLGGDADFEIVDSFDPFAEGIQFNVRPPKKSWKIISNLSGGEKTLSSLALVFALHHYKPSPLYVMDEIDAALDFKNVSIVAQYIKKRTKNAQFIIISLRSNMFELCDNLVGIYKVFNNTRSITIDPTVFGPSEDLVNTLQSYQDSESGDREGNFNDIPNNQVNSVENKELGNAEEMQYSLDGTACIKPQVRVSGLDLDDKEVNNGEEMQSSLDGTTYEPENQITNNDLVTSLEGNLSKKTIETAQEDDSFERPPIYSLFYD